MIAVVSSGSRVTPALSYPAQDTRAKIVDVATGSTATFSVPSAPTIRKPHGFVGTSVLATDFRVEALGRLKEQLILLEADGTTRSGDTFVNVAITTGRARAQRGQDLSARRRAAGSATERI